LYHFELKPHSRPTHVSHARKKKHKDLLPVGQLLCAIFFVVSMAVFVVGIVMLVQGSQARENGISSIPSVFMAIPSNTANQSNQHIESRAFGKKNNSTIGMTSAAQLDMIQTSDESSLYIQQLSNVISTGLGLTIIGAVGMFGSGGGLIYFTWAVCRRDNLLIRAQMMRKR